MKIYKAAFAAVSLLSVTSTAVAQVQFQDLGFGALNWTSLGSTTVTGWINVGEGTEVYGALSASIEWGINSATDEFGVVIENTGTSSVDGPLISSAITGFYLSRPAGEDPTYANNGEQITGSPINLINFGTDPDDYSDPNDWNYTGKLWSAFQGFGTDEARTLENYFGAESGTVLENSDGAPADPFQTGYFVFDMYGDVDVDTVFGSYTDVDVFVRWQSIIYDDGVIRLGVEGGVEEGSGKGAAGPGFDPALVPEPSEVALMAMLGMGGLLYLRRRFLKK